LTNAQPPPVRTEVLSVAVVSSWLHGSRKRVIPADDS